MNAVSAVNSGVERKIGRNVDCKMCVQLHTGAWDSYSQYVFCLYFSQWHGADSRVLEVDGQLCA